MANEKYDLCIIGGGPAGYAAAMRAIDFGKTVLLIEKNKVGGAGLFNGALSSKAFWECSTRFAATRNDLKDKGIDYSMHFSDALKVVEAAVFERKFQLNVHLNLLQRATHSKLIRLEKKIRYKPKGGYIWKTAQIDQPLYKGDLLLAGQDGTALIETEDGQKIQLQPGSSVVLDDVRDLRGPALWRRRGPGYRPAGPACRSD